MTYNLLRIIFWEIPHISLAFEFKLADLWIGLFWHKSNTGFDLWLGLIPCFPIHFKYEDTKEIPQ